MVESDELARPESVLSGYSSRRGPSSSAVTLEHITPALRSETDLSIVPDLDGRHDSDGEVDELEFRLSEDTGIMRSTTSVNQIPQMIRYSTSSRRDSAHASTPRDSVSSRRDSAAQDSLRESPLESPAEPPVSDRPHDDASTYPAHHRTGLFEQSLDPRSHTRNPSLPSESSHQATLQSEFAHLEEEKEQTVPEDDEGEWQDMTTVGSYEVYDEKGSLVVHRQGPEVSLEPEDKRNTSASKGYTRVAVDDDVRSVTSMDENTDFLFGEDDAGRDPLSQLQATKDMLTDSQRIAYVGLCRLVINAMATDLASIRGTRRISRGLSDAHGSMAMWAQKMMIRLYSHMELSPEEQIMIEQLSQHGVLPEDLSPSLMQAAKVKNPMQKDHDGDSKPTDGGDFADEKAAGSDPQPLATPGTNQTASDFSIQRPDEVKDLQTLDIDIRWTLLCDLFLVLISDSVYDARSRTLLVRVGKELGVTDLEICQFESKVTDALEIEEGSIQQWDESDILEKRRKKALRKKYMYVGLATLGGGLVIGLSAGLLAPVIGAGLAAGFTTVGITGTGTFLAGAGGAAVVTSTGVAVGARIGSKGMAIRMSHVKTFEFRPLHNNKRVNLIVTVSGWMSGKEDDVRLPFSTVDPIMGDILSVLWEPEMLQSMGQTINILATEVLTQSVQQILGQTVLVALMASVQLPMALSKLGYLLDNPWNVSLDRAWAAGLILADTLINRNLGVRPVTLVGFSLGARVIYSCLIELSRRGAHGLVQDVFIFGAPVVVKRDQFALARSIVSGRFVNGYSRKDWILGYLFRATSGGLGRVAGLAAVESVEDVENFDNTDLIEGHMAYRKAIPKLLNQVGWEVFSEEFTEIEDPDPDKQREKQRKLMAEFEDARKQMEEEQGKEKKTKKKSLFSWMKPKKKEWWEMAEAGPSEAAEPAEGSDSSPPEYSEKSAVMFDVDAIKREVETLAKDMPATAVALPADVPVNTFEEYDPGELKNFDDIEVGDSVQMSFDTFEDDAADRNGKPGIPSMSYEEENGGDELTDKFGAMSVNNGAAPQAEEPIHEAEVFDSVGHSEPSMHFYDEDEEELHQESAVTMHFD